MRTSRVRDFAILHVFLCVQVSNCVEPSINASAIAKANGSLQRANVSYEVFNSSSSDIETMVEHKLGPRKKDLSFQIFMSVTYTLIFVCGLIGNLCVCSIIICNNCMHTTTNYYLFSLAISDLLFLVIGRYTLQRNKICLQRRLDKL